MEDPIQEAVDAGVIVVNFDIDIAVDGVYKVTGDNYGMGVAGAEYIVDKIGTEGTVVALTVPTSGSVNDLRMQGFTDTMAEIAPDVVIKEYATQFTREAGLADMADILTAEPEIDAVYSHRRRDLHRRAAGHRRSPAAPTSRSSPAAADARSTST